MAEASLVDMIRVLFGRLSDLPDRAEGFLPSLKRLKMISETGGYPSGRLKRGRSALKKPRTEHSKRTASVTSGLSSMESEAAKSDEELAKVIMTAEPEGEDSKDLTDPYKPNVEPTMIEVALSLLSTALEVGGKDIEKFGVLLNLVKDDLARNISRLIGIIESIEGHCHKRMLDVKKEGNAQDGGSQSSTLTHEQLMALKHKKKLIGTATEQFNTKPSKGIAFMQDSGLFQNPLEPLEVASFLRENPHLDKKQLGDYISNEKTSTFWRPLSKASTLVNDSAFTLAYAVIMLNVDQHNVNHTKKNDPMTLEQFCRNLRGTNGGSDHDEDMLAEVYHNIRTNEIVMPAEQSGV
ncbi:Golgi-specific brefeldin A-resistance guanine nucleotide exchange factor 1-like Protein, partial [Caligus rogercresseyi]